MSVTIPNHSILTISESDLPTIADFLRASKLPLTINRLLYKDWPNEAAQSAQCTRAIHGGFLDPTSEKLKVVDDATGDIVAHLFLAHKKPATQTGGIAHGGAGTLPDAPEDMVPEVFHAVVKAMAEIEGVVSGVEHLAVTHIYVRPSSRNRGIGSSLIKQALEKGKAMGLPVFLTSEPQAHPLFLGLGFKDTGHVDLDLRKWAPDNCGFGVFRLSGMIVDTNRTCLSLS